MRLSSTQLCVCRPSSVFLIQRGRGVVEEEGKRGGRDREKGGTRRNPSSERRARQYYYLCICVREFIMYRSKKQKTKKHATHAHERMCTLECKIQIKTKNSRCERSPLRRHGDLRSPRARSRIKRFNSRQVPTPIVAPDCKNAAVHQNSSKRASF